MAQVIVGMSGGVDSAVSAYLLRQAGHEVAALFMKNWNDDDGTEYCTAAADLLHAEAVCHRLGIPLITVNFARQYWDQVFADFLKAYDAGETPNPDVLCNREIKFQVFFEHARRLGADLIATGHYARVAHQADFSPLRCSVDENKDQTYFLHAVAPENLRRTLFPLGGLKKPQVRQLALSLGLPNHAKKDSTGICFIGERRFDDFLQRYLKSVDGPMVDTNNQVVGVHRGLIHYTIGQRQGIGLGGRKDLPGSPYYVAAKDLKQNRLLVVQGKNHPRLFSQRLIGHDVSWLSKTKSTLHCQARIRHRQPLQTCHVTQQSNAAVTVEFDHPQRAITPGQYVVFYDQGYCLGGARIVATDGWCESSAG